MAPFSVANEALPLPNAHKKYLPAQFAPAVSLLFLGSVAASLPSVAEEIEAPQTLKASPKTSGCGENGALDAALFGSLETSVSWSGSDLICENMLRPDGQGVRLRFTGDVEGGRLDLIIALPDLKRGAAGKELPSKVTVTVEGSGRFFSTPNFDSCWTDIASQTPPTGSDEVIPISGTLYCVASLGEINGDAAVSIPELTFSTIVKWKR